MLRYSPEVDGAGLLLSLVPCCRQHDKGRLACGLEDTHECTKNSQAFKCVHGSDQGDTNTPQQDIDGKPLSNGNSLDDPVFLLGISIRHSI